MPTVIVMANTMTDAVTVAAISPALIPPFPAPARLPFASIPDLVLLSHVFKSHPGKGNFNLIFFTERINILASLIISKALTVSEEFQPQVKAVGTDRSISLESN